MDERDSFLRAIAEDLDDDTLRLVFADWLDDHGDHPRAEFIRVQIEAERQRNGSPGHKRLTDRAVVLLREHGDLWTSGYETAIPADAEVSVQPARYCTESGIMLLKGRREVRQGGWLDLFSKSWFRRGFVDEIVLTPERFFSLGLSDIHPTGPLPLLRLEVCDGWNTSFGALESFVGRLASAPLLCRFRDIRINAGFGSTTDEGLRLLANEPTLLTKLGGLCLSEVNMSDMGILPVLESRHLTGLCELAIDGTDCTEAAVQVLLGSDRFRGMTYLHLQDVIAGARGLRRFATPGRWPRLRCLWLAGCGLDDLTLRGLLRPGAFPALEVLDLACSDIHFSAVRALLLSGAYPRLRLLGVGGTSLTLDEVQSLRVEFGHQIELHFPVPRSHGRANAASSSGPSTPSS